MDSDSLTDEEIDILLSNIIKDEHIDNHIEKWVEVGSSKDGFLGVITRISVEGRDNEGNKKNLHLLIKSAPKNDYIRNAVPIRQEYEREIFMYTTIFRKFNELQKSKEVRLPFTGTAKCYATSLKEYSEALVLENLKEIGYEMWDRMQPMDHNHVKLVFSEYGRYHAMSLALKHQQPEIYNSFCNKLHYMLPKNPEENWMYTSFKHQSQLALKALQKQENIEAIKAFESFIIDSVDFMENVRFLDDDYTVVLHGDCWCNNVMFKYEDKEHPTTPTKLCFLDFQMSIIGSPVIDLSNFFYTCCGKDALQKLNFYLKVYHDSLSAHLKALGSNPEIILPFSTLQAQWKKFSKFGLYLAVLILHGMLSEKQEIPDLSEFAKTGRHLGDAFLFTSTNSEKYDERIKDVILHFVENKFI